MKPCPPYKKRSLPALFFCSGTRASSVWLGLGGDIAAMDMQRLMELLMNLDRKDRLHGDAASAHERIVTPAKFCTVTIVLLVFFMAFAGSAAAAPLKVGDTIAKISLPDMAGNKINLPEDTKGKVILIHFWASWCPYCAKEINAISTLHEALREKGFIPFSINVGEAKEVVEPYLAQLKVTYSVLLDANAEAVKACGVTGIPTTFICDGDGVIRYKIIGEVNKMGLEKILGTIFKN